MDGGLDDGDEWEDLTFIHMLLRLADEAEASRNPTPAPAPLPTYDPVVATPVSYLPASSVSSSHPSPALRFSPPRELTQRPPLPPPTAAAAAASARDALAAGADADRGFSPPRELSQRPAPEEGSLAIVAASGSAGDHRFVGTGGGGVGAKRDREAKELERLKRELNRVSKQMNELKNECTELRKDRTKKDLQIKAIEAEIQNLKKANVIGGGRSSKVRNRRGGEPSGIATRRRRTSC